MSFEKLNIRPEIVKALKEIGISKPTEIQEKTIPLIHSGKDVIGHSKTGSGKTAAFGVPILEKLDSGKGLQALILAPTRELAVQIAGEMHKFGKYMHFNIATVYGGVSLEPQIHKIARANIVVATPGRLLDHLERRNINLSRISYFVLDEADKMVEMGFIEDVVKILECMPKNRQMLLFGATSSEEISRIEHKYMNHPSTVQAEAHVKEEFLEQYYYDVEPHEKFSLLVHLLKKEEVQRAIIFCSTRSTVEVVANNLRKNGIKTEMIHGKLTQSRRLNVIESFNKGKVNILVASTVAARGLHIEDVSHVFNYDLSRNHEEYIHRIGRTARAGQTGKAITLLSPKDHDAFRSVLSMHPVKVKMLPKEEFPRIPFEVGSRYPRRSGFDRRSSGRSSQGHGRRSYSRPHRY